MRWIFLRHAYAGESFDDENQLTDFRRQLTGRGIEELRYVIFRSLPIFSRTEVIYSSPLVRALQTAEVLWSFIPHAKLEIMPSLDKLMPPDEFLKELRQHPVPDNSCFVGHNPHMEEVIKRLIGPGRIELEKSGIAVVEGEVEQKFGLSVLISPETLRQI
jgi:phosphohistidine phosphatase SixA